MDAVVAKDLSHFYPVQRSRVWALKDFNLRVPDDQFLCVLGPTGCGKSTFMRMVTGLLKPSSGEIRLHGQPISGPGIDRGVVFQDAALLPWLRVLENVMFALRHSGLPKQERRELARQALEVVGLANYETLYPYQLSGGMRSRVAVARAWALPSARTLLMDEPFAALDAITRQRLQEHLVQMWSTEKRTVIYITHDIDEAVFLADRVIVMTPSPGRISSDILIDLPRPRQRSSAEYARYRATLNAALASKAEAESSS